AFQSSSTVLVAGFTVAVAGALSMAAGAYGATSSEAEVRQTETGRRRFLGDQAVEAEQSESAVASSIVVGSAYFAGALIPVLPVLAGARTVIPSLLAGGSLIIVVTLVLAFLSGMNIRRRIVTNLVIIAVAVGVSYAIGAAARWLFGISV